MKDKEARMLPSDFTKYIKVKNSKKNLKKEKGFFTFPDELKGNQEVGERPFLVFYFDNQKQYEFVRKIFELHGTGARSHPDLDSRRLYRATKVYKKSLRKK